MAQAVLLPKLGQTVEEAAIVKWHKQEGDAVRKGEVIFEIETDKAVLEAESFFEGTLLKILVGEGETVPVQSVVAYIGKAGEKAPGKTASLKPATAAAQAAEPPAAQEPEPRRPAEDEPPAPASPPSVLPRRADTESRPASPPPRPPEPVPPPQPAPARRLFITPRARKLAEASVIDPARIRGSGPNGRILVKDVEAWLEANRYHERKITPAAKRLAAASKVDILTVRGTGLGGRITVEDVERSIAARPRPLSRMRQTIAQRLTRSFTTTPHFYVTVTVDMTDLLSYRQELKETGQSFTVTDFILEAVILSLREFPALNSVCDGSTIRWYESVDLGMAVGLDDGLVVPVIRNAGDLCMVELHDTAQDLAARAREGKLLPDEMTGSSFTVSNMGMCDVDNFHAIINPGESGILAVSSTRDEVAAVDGRMQIRARMKITLSCDHRIVDGTRGAMFVNAVKAKLEDTELWRSLTL